MVKSLTLSGIFLVTLLGLFWLAYKSFKLKGWKRFLVSFKIAFIFTLVLLGLIPSRLEVSEPYEPYVPNNPFQTLLVQDSKSGVAEAFMT